LDIKDTIGETFERAIAAHGNGALARAEQLYEGILTEDARHFGALYHLGLVRLQQARFADAESLFRRAVKADKRSPEAHHSLAIALTGLAHYDDAIQHYQKALQLGLREAPLHNNIGYALQRLDRHKEAANHFRRALTLNPNYAEAHNNLGNSLQSLNRTDEAIEHYRKALLLRPDFAEAHNNLGSALASKNRFEEAIEQCRKALALAPGNFEAHMNLANSLGALELLPESLTHYEQAIALDPANPEPYARAGFMLFHAGRVDDAITYCEKALAIDPGHVNARRNLGVALRAIGKIAEAVQCFEKVLAAAPEKAAGAYYNLATTRKMTPSDPHFAAMQKLAGKIESLETEDQITLHFALGKAFADTGDHRSAFRHLLKGNALKRREFVDYDEAKALQRFERIEKVFDHKLIEEKGSVGYPSPAPIFIVGMPRSGTSLVEQILASHPKVFGAGELYEMGTLADSIRGAGDIEFPEAVAELSGDRLRTIGKSYVDAIRALAPNAERITDKMPGNFANVGLIHLALPNARIIHTCRDPRDTATSCFSLLFALGHAYSYDLAELGRYLRAYQKLMRHWHQLLPEGVMIDVQYETLVSDLEAQAKRIVAHCGLEWDDACLSFYEAKRPVRTASVIQVRQPIYGSSVGRWRAYESELQPLLSELSKKD
jgi:tetratricopeptide (TPR) repeat protein